jgi:GTPase
VAFADPRKKVMLSDTVGFISRLPTYMVESFKSTLEELTYADLVLLLLDASESIESMTTKLTSCLETLDQLKVDPNKVLLILTKIDLVKSPDFKQLETLPMFEGMSVMKISAVRGDGMHHLKTRIIQRAFHSEKTGVVSKLP